MSEQIDGKVISNITGEIQCGCNQVRVILCLKTLQSCAEFIGKVQQG